MIHKHVNKRTRAWRRFQEDRVVRKRMRNNPMLLPMDSWRFGETDCDIEYGRTTIGDLFGTWKEHFAKTSNSDRKPYWRDEEFKYKRTKYKQQTKRLLWEENIIERGGNLRFPPRQPK